MIAVGEVAKAEQEAAKGDESKAMEYLAKAGTWAFETAKTIGVPVAIEALKRATLP